MGWQCGGGWSGAAWSECWAQCHRSGAGLTALETEESPGWVSLLGSVQSSLRSVIINTTVTSDSFTISVVTPRCWGIVNSWVVMVVSDWFLRCSWRQVCVARRSEKLRTNSLCCDDDGWCCVLIRFSWSFKLNIECFSFEGSSPGRWKSNYKYIA